jgi:hypothetical protein
VVKVDDGILRIVLVPWDPAESLLADTPAGEPGSAETR